jgi:hypothetical protein
MIAAPTDGRSGNEWLPNVLLRVKVIVSRRPVNIGELQASDLTGANAIDGSNIKIA